MRASLSDERPTSSGFAVGRGVAGAGAATSVKASVNARMSRFVCNPPMVE